MAIPFSKVQNTGDLGVLLRTSLDLLSYLDDTSFVRILATSKNVRLVLGVQYKNGGVYGVIHAKNAENRMYLILLDRIPDAKLFFGDIDFKCLVPTIKICGILIK